jgi:mannose-6-phosphate isomerase
MMILSSTQKSSSPPWGSFAILFEAPGIKVKKIEIRPGLRSSYQIHQFRSESWTIVSGEALVLLNDQEFRLRKFDQIEIPAGAKHRVQNIGAVPLVFIEIQRGSYCGDDDIVRLTDDFGRA